MDGNDKRVFYNTTLLDNERPFKFVIDSGSPVPLIKNCLLKKTTKVNHQLPLKKMKITKELNSLDKRKQQ